MSVPESLPDAGLTPGELELVLAELDASLAGAEVVDAVLLDRRDDLLLFAETPDGRRALHVVPGGRRARVCTTARRFPRAAFATGPRPDRIAELVRGAAIAGFEPIAGERRFTLQLQRPDRALALECELFGARGLWVLREADGTILALSRLPNVAGRELRPGACYAPPGSPATRRPDPAPRFAAPVDAAIDAAFTALDLDEEAQADRTEVERALDRELSRRRSRLAGLERQRVTMEDAGELRMAADMLMAYGATLPPDAAEVRVPHPDRPHEEIVVPRDPRVRPHVQAQALYKRARKHEDGRESCERRIVAARAAVRELEELHARVEGDATGELRAELERRGILRPARPAKPDAARQRLQKVTKGENFRRFESTEGMLILVGRDNAQNDRLSTRTARGNDLWLHVGRGYAGSHVVVRVPKGRTASLETLLDAATLAVHFSKVRGATLEEVIYTQAKNVRKAKGMPPGKVIASRTRSIRVRLEPERLERLLSSTDPSDPPIR